MRVLRLACTLAGVAAIPVHDIASHSPGEVTPVNESPELHLSKSNVPTVPKDEPAELLAHSYVPDEAAYANYSGDSIPALYIPSSTHEALLTRQANRDATELAAATYVCHF